MKWNVQGVYFILIPNLPQYLSKNGQHPTSTYEFKDEKTDWWYFAPPTHISPDIAQCLGKELNGVLRCFQQYFSHIMATVHIIHVFPAFHQY